MSARLLFAGRPPRKNMIIQYFPDKWVTMLYQRLLSISNRYRLTYTNFNTKQHWTINNLMDEKIFKKEKELMKF